MKIFVTGATGYIGFNVAKKFRQNGFKVYGLTRSTDKAEKLYKNEIIPVIGNMSDPGSFLTAAKECDVIIHAAVDYGEKSVEFDKNVVNSITDIKSNGSGKKTFIYTSGCWVYGNTDGIADENAILKPAKKVEWRHEVEEIVINSENVNGVVIRPGCVYGKEGSLTNIWFNEAVNENKLNVIGDGNNHWAMIHVDDLAEFYFKVFLSKCAKEYFNSVDDSHSTINEMVKAIAETTNYNGEINYCSVEEAENIMGLLAEPLAFDQQLNNSKAKDILNWQPKFNGFVNDVETYFNSWKSSQK
ncbi:MAG: NAD-dependent epimerase/dehydratase family protein [Bacteroidetes bacterium]|nr:NAD-dependent epimerase/dehydratase family protein [Bacteroidota bacterium]